MRERDIEIETPDGDTFYIRSYDGQPEVEVYDSEGERAIEASGKPHHLVGWLGGVFGTVAHDESPMGPKPGGDDPEIVVRCPHCEWTGVHESLVRVTDDHQPGAEVAAYCRNPECEEWLITGTIVKRNE